MESKAYLALGQPPEHHIRQAESTHPSFPGRAVGPQAPSLATNAPRVISQNSTDSETGGTFSTENAAAKVEKLADFVDQKTAAKSHVQALIKHVAREARRHRMDYHQLRFIFRMARKRAEINVPAPQKRRLRELPSTAELSQFYAAISDPMHRLLFEVLEGTGLRVSELCNLQVARIDLAANLLFVSEGKGGKDRVVIIGNRLREKLELFLRGKDNRYLFETVRRTKFTPRRIEQLCGKYKLRAGIEKPLTPHVFRHLWATSLAAAGVSEERRALLAGHSSVEMQRHYTHLTGGGLRDEIVSVLDKIANR